MQLPAPCEGTHPAESGRSGLEYLLRVEPTVPPSFGVDISPVVWIAVASFLREILLGQQGILVLMAQGRM